MDGDEFYFYNKRDSLYALGDLRSDAKLCFYKDGPTGFEYLSSGSREFLYKNRFGITSTEPIVAAFKTTKGKIRIGKNLGPDRDAVLTLFYPGLKNVMVDSQLVLPSQSGPGWMTVTLSPKQRQIGPSGFEQTVTENYSVEILADPPVKVLAPNGGELWAAGSTQTIRWQAEAAFATVAIDFSGDFGATWQPVTDSTANDSAFTWTVPAPVTDNALIRLRPAGAAQPFDVSDGSFSLDKPPVLNSFAPQRAPAGSIISLFGENLRRVNAISFAGTLATEFTVAADTLIRVTVPDSARSGKIAISNRIGSAVSTARFTVGAAPVVDSFSPPAGAVGVQVFVRGTGFLDATGVAFGEAAANAFAVLSDSLLRATVPAAAKTGVIAVSNPVGTGFSSSVFRVQRPPVIFGFTPGRGPAGTGVDIFGRNLLDVVGVRFGDAAADSFSVRSDSLVFARVPSGANSGPVALESALGTATSEGRFTIIFAPLISGFSPRTGPVGAQVRLSGRYFSDVVSIAFGGLQADFFRIESDSVLLATVPAGATSGKIALTGAGKTVESAVPFVVVQPIRKEILRPAEDGFTDSSAPNTSFGASPILQAGAGTLTGYLKFDASGADKSARAVTLRLFVVAGGGSSRVYRTANSFTGQSSPWTESALTAGNAPKLEGVALDSAGMQQPGQWVEFNALDAWDGRDTLSLAVVSAAPETIQYSSAEGTQAPELVITSQPVADLRPSIDVFSPGSGTAGDEITISGTRMNEVTSVAFAGFPATRFAADSFTRLRVRVPFFAAPGPVTVANYAGETVADDVFDFVRPVGDSVRTFLPAEDTYVEATDAARNYGDRTELAAGDSAGSRTNAYLKFLVNGIEREVFQARLQVTVVAAGDSAGTIYRTLNNEADRVTPWSESRLTWLSAPPAIGRRLFSAGGAVPGNAVFFDLTQSIAGDGEYSFVIANASPERFVFASKESGAAPVLTVVTGENVTSAGPVTPPGGEAVLPDTPMLTANYPNPFNAGTRIEYRLPRQMAVELSVFNLLGQRVQTLVDEVRRAGVQSTFWNGRDAGGRPLASGIYLVRLRAGAKVRLLKILLQK